jgi:ribosome biogenesis GTPase / thiamine phosphate phosphatase
VLTLPDIGWDAGWDDAWAQLDEGVSAPCEPVRVVGVDRGAVDLLGATGATRATLGGDVLDAMARDPASAPCAGDWGALRCWSDGRTTLEAVLPRRSAFRRAVAGRESYEQVLAANADEALVVVSLAVEPDLRRLERLVALAWDSGAQPVVVLTKADLVTDAGLIAEDASAAAPGVDVLVVSAVSGEGMPGLAARAAGGRTLALLGQSGVGKSTLVNWLAGADVLAVADVGARGKGRHTTTRRELVPLPGGGLLLDTPGLRSVGLGLVEDGLEMAFPDVEELAAHCRFGDCAHAGEPGCAVEAAVDSGELPLRRLESWRHLQREAAWMARRSDARLRAEERRKWSAVSRSLRRDGVVRP